MARSRRLLRWTATALGRIGGALRDVVFEPVSPHPLAAYRIGFALVLLAEFFYAVNRRHLFFLEAPLTATIPTAVVIDLSIWFVALVALLTGALTPIAAYLNYRFVVQYFGCDGRFVYHADMLYIPTALLLVMLPSYRVWSIDRWIVRRVFGLDLGDYPVPRFFQSVALFWVVGFMYFDSSLYKLASPFWLDGLGFWLPASFPSFTMWSWNAVLNQKLPVQVAGYLTLAFELSFVFVFWIRRARPVIFVLGLILHLGIAITFPIPLFGLLMVIQYANLFPDPALNRGLDRVARWVGWTEAEDAPPSRALVPPQRPFLAFDLGVTRVLMVGILAVSMVQVGVTFKVPIFSAETHTFMRKNCAITGHAVFGHWQFTAMTQDIALAYVDDEGRERWLPWIRRNGHVGRGAYGRFWTFWWLMSLPGAGGADVAFAQVSEEWARREGVDLGRGEVRVRQRPVLHEHQWERDRQKKMKEIPWRDVAVIRWPGGKREYRIVP